jgi:hypothetical protein
LGIELSFPMMTPSFPSLSVPPLLLARSRNKSCNTGPLKKKIIASLKLNRTSKTSKSYIYNLKLLNTSTTHGRMVRATMPRRTIRGVNVVSDHA